MSIPEVKRKLATILSGDVKGYSRLLAKDEHGTIHTLNAHKEVMKNLIQQCQGKVIDAPGDNVLAEFPSVVDAVQCAVEIQKELKNRNDELPEHRRVEFRFGINLGEVSEKEEKIFGDGLNIAARIQNLADAGGICLSGIVYEQIKDRLELRYEYIGKQTVKNIAEPVRVYRILPVGETASLVSSWKRIGLNYWNRINPAVKIIVALIIAANGVWQFYTRFINPSFDVTPKDKIAEVASVGKMALPLPDKPSIAVLPFTNMSNDPKQEYFSDGLTEEIITALSKVPKLFVIARNSTFTYKGKPVKVQQVGQELGVRYVLEGSVRKDGNNIRITAQLIDALTGNHLWADRYDRNMKDIFAVQDEITKKIITSMQVQLTEGEEAQSAAGGTNNLEAYLKCLQGRELNNRHNPESTALARQFAEEAIALDPKFAGAYALLASTHLNDYFFGFSKSPKDSLEKSRELLQKAITLDDTYAQAHGLLGWILSMTGQYDKAFAEGEKAVTLSPNSADSHMHLGKILFFAGRYEESIAELKTAIRLNPIPPTIYLYSVGSSYARMGHLDEAIPWCEKAVRREPNALPARLIMAAVYSQAGQDKKARIEAAEVLRINPQFSLEKYAKSVSVIFKNQEDVERTLIGPLRKAGLK
jgi:adenylate cyclase